MRDWLKHGKLMAKKSALYRGAKSGNGTNINALHF
jgi:hypothetical protein